MKQYSLQKYIDEMASVDKITGSPKKSAKRSRRLEDYNFKMKEALTKNNLLKIYWDSTILIRIHLFMIVLLVLPKFIFNDVSQISIWIDLISTLLLIVVFIGLIVDSKPYIKQLLDDSNNLTFVNATGLNGRIKKEDKMTIVDEDHVLNSIVHDTETNKFYRLYEFINVSRSHFNHFEFDLKEYQIITDSIYCDELLDIDNVNHLNESKIDFYKLNELMYNISLEIYETKRYKRYKSLKDLPLYASNGRTSEFLIDLSK